MNSAKPNPFTVEQATGNLTADEANNLFARLRDDEAKRSQLPAQGTTAYFHEVKSIYRDYDRIANAMKSDSHEGDKELAGTYSCVTF